MHLFEGHGYFFDLALGIHPRLGEGESASVFKLGSVQTSVNSAVNNIQVVRQAKKTEISVGIPPFERKVDLRVGGKKHVPPPALASHASRGDRPRKGNMGKDRRNRLMVSGASQGLALPSVK
jgi:hypothetical protein